MPATSRSPQNTVKKQFFFDFLKVYNELGKDKKFETSRPFFQEKLPSEKVRAKCAPCTIKVKTGCRVLVMVSKKYLCVAYAYGKSNITLKDLWIE